MSEPLEDKALLDWIESRPEGIRWAKEGHTDIDGFTVNPGCGCCAGRQDDAIVAETFRESVRRAMKRHD